MTEHNNIEKIYEEMYRFIQHKILFSISTHLYTNLSVSPDKIYVHSIVYNGESNYFYEKDGKIYGLEKIVAKHKEMGKYDMYYDVYYLINTLFEALDNLQRLCNKPELYEIKWIHDCKTNKTETAILYSDVALSESREFPYIEWEKEIKKLRREEKIARQEAEKARKKAEREAKRAKKQKPMKYYKMIDNTDEIVKQNYIMCRKLLNYDKDYYHTLENYVCAGKFVKNWNPETTLVCEDETQTTVPDVMLVPEYWLVVSKRFVDVVAPFVKDEIQYLPLKLKAVQPQMQNEEFVVANITTVLDAVDMEKSLYLENFDLFTAFFHYALKGDLIKNHHIFKVKEDFASFGNFVSEDVKNAIEAAGLKGFYFENVTIT